MTSRQAQARAPIIETMLPADALPLVATRFARGESFWSVLVA